MFESSLRRWYSRGHRLTASADLNHHWNQLDPKYIKQLSHSSTKQNLTSDWTPFELQNSDRVVLQCSKWVQRHNCWWGHAKSKQAYRQSVTKAKQKVIVYRKTQRTKTKKIEFLDKTTDFEWSPESKMKRRIDDVFFVDEKRRISLKMCH